MYPCLYSLCYMFNDILRRDPESLVKPIKGDPTEKESKDRANKLDKQKSTATRHLLLIRHGQYNLEGKEDSDRYLTKLGQMNLCLSQQNLLAFYG